jgi:hypothetical protein
MNLKLNKEIKFEMNSLIGDAHDGISGGCEIFEEYTKINSKNF